jgi:tetratricopeptide (TPR) repeat protein
VRDSSLKSRRQGANSPLSVSSTSILTRDPSIPEPDDKSSPYPIAALKEYAWATEDNLKGRRESAAEHFEKALKLAPNYYDAHVDLGIVHQQLHRNAEAEKQLRAAHELKPDAIRPLLNLGRVLFDEFETELHDGAVLETIRPTLDTAIEVLEQAIVRDEKSAPAHYLLGAAAYRSTSYTKAEVQLKRALELDSSLFPARLMLANADIKLRRWEDALDNIDAYILENPAAFNRSEAMATRAEIMRGLSAQER